MSYLKFDKGQLINLQYSLYKEFLRTNRAGSFASSTIINCNTRKYHGLLISPLPELDCGWHLLLSALDETIIQHEKEFHLAVRRYPNIFHPGHKYIREFELDPIPSITYRVGGVVLKKEMLLAEEEATVLIRYTLVEANSATKLKLHPFLAFRNIHTLSKANLNVIAKYENVDNGVRTKMYEPYPYLYLQLSKTNEYISAPDWFYNIEYSREIDRGYDAHEDLFVPGYFEFPIEKGESIIFSGSLVEASTKNLKKRFDAEIKKRTPRTNFENVLKNSAEQFFYKQNKQTELLTDFPFLSRIPRSSFIALPGLTVPYGKFDLYKQVLNAMSKLLQEDSIFFLRECDHNRFNSVDTPLWYIWAIQQYYIHSGDQNVWKNYGKYIRQIFSVFKQGTEYNIKLHENGLIWFDNPAIALSWMDSHSDGAPVVQRQGYLVEVNALWYNALVFAIEIAQKAENGKFVSEWKDVPQRTKEAFVEKFWNKSKGYLADYVYNDYTDWKMRPNQIIATSVPNSPIDDEIQDLILRNTKTELLTPRGLRTLTPTHPDYKGFCHGTVNEREKSYHQGMAWPWLLAHYADASLRLYERSILGDIKKLYNGFEEVIGNHGIGSISEMYEGNPPFDSRGAISQASSVAALVWIKMLIDKYEAK